MKLTTFLAPYEHVLFTCSENFSGFARLPRQKSLLVRITFFPMLMEKRKVNKFGRSYRLGDALDQDLKCSIIDRGVSHNFRTSCV